MSMPEVASHFLELLQQSELLTPEQFARVAEQYEPGEDSSAADLARALVADGWITRFQAQRLLEGRSRGFFLDRYKLQELLGTGGIGGVYLAENTETGRRVALKVLSEEHRHDSGMMARFKIEARAGMKLGHPRIVGIDDVGHTGAADYLVMEYVEGITLDELVRLYGRRSWRQACDMIRQAAEGLAHAHAQGLVHRDVKPANLLVLADGCVKIVDFGLALVGDRDEDEFSLAMIFGHQCLGSADYMAPEQSLDSSAVDPRADIYSLGCTFYSALTGRLPFPFESVSKTLQAHRTESPRPLSELASSVPEPVIQIVERMMAKRPEDRFQTADEVVAALEPHAERSPVEFDFRKVLNERTKKAQRKSGSLRKQSTRTKRSATAAATVSGGGSPSSSAWRGGSSSALGGSSATGRSSATRREDSWSRSRDSSIRSSSRRTAEDHPAPPATDGARPHKSGLRPRAWLIPGNGGPAVPIDGDQIVIGRAEGCDVLLDRAGVSNRHCKLSREDGRWIVRDLDSKNGVQVNGEDVTEQALRSGDRLTIAGQYPFRFHSGEKAPFRFRQLLKPALVTALVAALLLTAFVLWWTLRG